MFVPIDVPRHRAGPRATGCVRRGDRAEGFGAWIRQSSNVSAKLPAMVVSLLSADGAAVAVEDEHTTLTILLVSVQLVADADTVIPARTHPSPDVPA
jgi:hypothetical protein